MPIGDVSPLKPGKVCQSLNFVFPKNQQVCFLGSLYPNSICPSYLLQAKSVPRTV